MAYDQNTRNKPATIAKDKDALANIKNFNPAYAPAKVDFSVAAMTTALTAMETAQQVEAVKQRDFEGARDAANAAEWAFHNLILGAKTQVIAQYGQNSDQMQAVGLKKKSEYKRPTARQPVKKVPA